MTNGSAEGTTAHSQFIKLRIAVHWWRAFLADPVSTDWPSDRLGRSTPSVRTAASLVEGLVPPREAAGARHGSATGPLDDAQHAAVAAGRELGFIRASPADGILAIIATQLAYMLDGVDWLRDGQISCRHIRLDRDIASALDKSGSFS